MAFAKEKLAMLRLASEGNPCPGNHEARMWAKDAGFLVWQGPLPSWIPRRTRKRGRWVITSSGREQLARWTVARSEQIKSDMMLGLSAELSR